MVCRWACPPPSVRLSSADSSASRVQTLVDALLEKTEYSPRLFVLHRVERSPTLSTHSRRITMSCARSLARPVPAACSRRPHRAPPLMATYSSAVCLRAREQCRWSRAWPLSSWRPSARLSSAALYTRRGCSYLAPRALRRTLGSLVYVSQSPAAGIATTSRSSCCACLSAVATGSSTGSVKSS